MAREAILRGKAWQSVSWLVLPEATGEAARQEERLAQIGAQKPSIRAPINGLFYVGRDAGGTGVGTQQAIESGIHVADAAYRHHHLRKGNR